MTNEELDRAIARAVAEMHAANARARADEWPWRLPEEDYEPNEGLLDAVDKEWAAFIASASAKATGGPAEGF